MEITVGKHSGFCFGVKRAVDMVLKEAECCNEKVYTLGPIIHNRLVVDNLAARGIVAVGALSEITEGIVVIRSHGVGSSVYEEALRRQVRIVDATCPFVKKIHQLVSSHAQMDYVIVIVGKADHPEVEGIKGWSGESSHVVYEPCDVQKIQFNDYDKICVVAQTTITRERFESVVAEVKKRVPEAAVFDTICSATMLRQQEAEEMACNMDAMIVIGDENSSNTKRLFELCKQHCNNTFAILSAYEVIDKLKGSEKIGIVAGASTPEWVIKEVIYKMTEEQKKTELEAQETAADNTEAVENANETMEGFEKTMVKLRNGQYVTGTVISVTDNNVYVNLGYKADGIIPKSEYELSEGQSLQDVVSVSDVVDVEVVQVNDGDGNVVLSRKPILEKAAWNDIVAMKDEGKVITVKITEAVKGGAVATYNSLRVFIPASQLANYYIKKIESMVGKEVNVKFIDVNPREKRIVASRKIVLAEERQKKEEEFWAKYNVGDIINGKVKTITSFGAFVDMGLFDGLIHISELTWDNVSSVTDVLNVGDEVEVKISAIDKENKKISLNRKTLLPHPWETIDEKYAVGDIINGKVVRLTDFGAIVMLEPHIDAILHISQISRKRVEKVADVLAVGDEVEAKIVSIEPEKRRISISKKVLEPKLERSEGSFERKPRFNSDKSDKKGYDSAAPRKPRRTSFREDTNDDSSIYTKEEMTINLGDFFPQEMLDEIREAKKN